MRLDAIARRALVANAAATTADCYSKEIYPVAKEPTRVRVGPPATACEAASERRVNMASRLILRPHDACCQHYPTH